MNKQQGPTRIEWRPVVGYEGLYEVSNNGQIKRLAGSPKCHHDRILKPIKRKGHSYVMLCANSVIVTIGVHRLVLAAFVGTANGLWVNHKNGIKDDNRLANLEYVTPSQNTQHAYDNGLNSGPRGERNKHAKLTEADVREIRKLLTLGWKHKDIAKQFNIAMPTISAIRNNKQWRHVT